MAKQTVSGGGPTAGPYSPGVTAGGFCFVSGQIGFDPASGRIAEGGIAEEFRQAVANLGAILEGAGCALTDVVATTIFVTDLAEFGAVNVVFGEVFPESPPTRATVEVSALPLGAAVEIVATAVLP